ncbi:O-antigen ligase family protein [Galactobacillus timonensis]|uniref:O-antigen ligase family protein n=1 Tax=Galactobacillus timonensis TaxID=2041840 RepID=UPI0023EFD559|nr:O-antigen ligase family protein [Galactobacillus timonensis]MCI6754454.1 O-antigen ligase family protein [Galactobacillus timonensis]
MKQIKDFFLGRKNLACLYTLVLLYLVVLLRKSTYGTIHDVFRMFFALWTVFLCVHDLVKRQIPRQIPVLFQLWIFAAGFLSLVFQTKGRGIDQINTLMVFATLGYVFFTLPFFTTKEEFNKLILFLALNGAAVLFLMNAASLIVLGLHGMGNTSVSSLYESMLVMRGTQLRYFGYHQYPTLAGFNSMLAMILGFIFVSRHKKPVWYVLQGANCVLALAMIHLAHARGAMLACVLIAVSLVLILLAKKIGGRRTMRIFWTVVLAGIAVVLLVFHAKIAGLITYYSDPEHLYNLTSERNVIWAAAVDGFRQRPLTGWGWLNGSLIEPITHPSTNNCHNLFFNILLWTGLLGTIPFLLLIVYSLVRILRHLKDIYRSNDAWILVLVLCGFIQCMLDIALAGQDNRLMDPYFYLAFGGILFSDRLRPEGSLKEAVR